MPQLIRQVFSERIRQSEVMTRLLRELEAALGLPIGFHPAGMEVEDCTSPCYRLSGLCRHLHQSGKGGQLCQHDFGRLLSEAHTAPATGFCSGQTTLCAVPVPSSAGLLGFLVCGGSYPSPLDIRRINRIRHLLDRQGIEMPPDRVSQLVAGTPVIETGRMLAIQTVLQMAAGHVVKHLSAELFGEKNELPDPVRRACRYVQQHFREDPTLAQTAAAVGLSHSHLSRVFHASTGLRFKEYLNEVRLQAARRALRESHDRVSEVALEVGFRSISQFNRQFSTHYGLPPREYRKRYRSTVSR